MNVKIENDSWRQWYHLMPPQGWLNDPNGLCYFQGNYHVFYQYSPDNVNGGEKYWGHYISSDLIRWRECPIMLSPDKEWDSHGVYSGSALLADDKMYLYYTGNVKHAGNYDYIYEGRGHNTAVAVTSDGMHVEEERLLLENADYPSDLSCHVRDPKVFAWEGKYYMVLGARTRDDVGEVLVWESEDKFHWTHINTLVTPEAFGFMWECPDLFKVDGQWILGISPQGLTHETYQYQNVYSSGYFPLIGDFRKKDCTLGAFQELDFGFDFYAPQTFEKDDRRILIGWMGMPDAEYTNPTTERGWQHCLTIPRDIHYKEGQLCMTPVPELEALRKEAKTCKIQKSGRIQATPAMEFAVEGISDGWSFSYEHCVSISWENGVLKVVFPKQDYGRTSRNMLVPELKNLRIFMDASSMEVFANDGSRVMTFRFYPEEEGTILVSGTCELTFWELNGFTYC